MTNNFYTFALTERRRMLAEKGFALDDLRIWAHPDGRAIGEGVAAALADKAFLRFLKVESDTTNELRRGHGAKKETNSSLMV